LAPRLQAERVLVADSIEAANDYFYEREWTDGLPIIPPTPERVEAMLRGVDHDPQAVVAKIPPYWADATVEKIAINAVMAGCRPEYLPVVVAGVQALGDPSFNLYGIQATTHPAGTLIIVNGPIASRLGINAGPNAFGQGNRANATIGRAVRLTLINVGGGRPGSTDKSTQGQPGKYTYCVAENEAESPWEPLHVERGHRRDDSTVTVVGAAGPQNIADLFSKDAGGVLMMLGHSSRASGGNNFLLGGEPLYALCPEHAAILARDGLSKAEVKRRLWELARVPLRDFSPENQEIIRRERAALYASVGADTPVHIADRPDDLMLIVVGGPGGHSALITTFGHTRAVTRPVPAGTSEGARDG
jgi:hypothetical protein